MKKIPAGQRRISVFKGLTAAMACALLFGCDEKKDELSDNHSPYLPNGSFEEGGDGWDWPDKAKVAVVKSSARTGIASLQISTAAPNSARVDGPRFPVTPGNAYRVGLWVRTVHPGPATFEFRFYTINNDPVKAEKSAPVAFPAQPGSWQKLQITVTAPPDSYTGAIFITAGSAESEFLIDDATVEEMGKS
ncbi:MAG TPA: carbohydrate binding domain-containing protein [Chthoniobacterales bacterium]